MHVETSIVFNRLEIMYQNMDTTKNSTAGSSNLKTVSSNASNHSTICKSLAYENEFACIMENTSVKYSTQSKTILGKGSSSLVYPGYHFELNVLLAVKRVKKKFLW